MLNVLIAGVGGQGSVLAAKMLAQAAARKGWQVRTAETIGMAQRGGSVASHVRIGDKGEQVHAPLVPMGQANCIIALEPGEGLRALPYLAPDGLLVCAQDGIASIAAGLAGGAYDPAAISAYLQQTVPHFVLVDGAAICSAAGGPKALNVGMLAAAVQASSQQACGLGSAISLEELRDALRVIVKEQFVSMNERAIDAALAAIS